MSNSAGILSSCLFGGLYLSLSPSRAYRQVQLQFVQATKSFDTESLTALWRVYPWHVDTLLQLSEVSRHQGDLGQAGDFVSRALFAFERTDGSNFVKSFLAPSSNVTTMPPHSSIEDPLPFEKIENRAFYLASHRHVSYLGRRGVWRTTLEWCKFILGVNTTDPHAMILWIDFLAVKSGQGEWLLEFYDKLEEMKGGKNSCDWNVGLCYAKALALRAVEKDEHDKVSKTREMRVKRSSLFKTFTDLGASSDCLLFRPVLEAPKLFDEPSLYILT